MVNHAVRRQGMLRVNHAVRRQGMLRVNHALLGDRVN